MLEQWEPGTEVVLANSEGLELLVLDGEFEESGDRLDRWSWLRLPAGEPLRVQVGNKGARVWYKAAPLLHANVCAFEVGQR